MNDIIKSLVKIFEESPKKVYRFAWKVGRVLVFLLLTLKLFEILYGTINFPESSSELFDFLRNGLFVKPLIVLVFSFTLFEVVLSIILLKTMGFICVNKALRIQHYIRKHPKAINKVEKIKLHRVVNIWSIRLVRKAIRFLSYDAKQEEFKDSGLHVIKSHKSDAIDSVVLWITQLYILFIFIGNHNYWYDMGILAFIVLSSFYKFTLIIARETLNFLDTENEQIQ